MSRTLTTAFAWPHRSARAKHTATFTTLVLMAALAGFTTPTSAATTPGSTIGIDFTAAESTSYDHAVGGGAFDNGTENHDVVHSLEGSDVNCDDIVTFLTQVKVGNGTAVSFGQMTLALDYEFTMDTTGQSGGAFADILTTRVNYAPVVDLIDGDTVDQGNVDNGDSVATLTSETTTGPIYTAGSKLLGTAQINNLSSGEWVVLRMDVRVTCKSGASPTGNLQAQLTDARVLYTNGNTPVSGKDGAVSSGIRTVPLKKFGELAAPSIDINKTTNGGDGVEIRTGLPVTWSYVVTNTGNVELTNVAVTDDQLVSVSCPATRLAVGANMTCTAHGTAVRGWYANIGTATAQYGTVTVTDADASAYFGFEPAIDIQKTPDEQTVIQGETATFTIAVTNTGNVALTDVTVSDPMAPACSRVIGAMAIGATVSYTCSLADVQMSFDNIATVSGWYGTYEVNDADSAHVTDDILPNIDVQKSVEPATVPETGGMVTYTFTVINANTEPFVLTSLVDNRLGNLDGVGTCTVGDAYAIGQQRSCTVTTWVQGPALSTLDNTVTAVGTDAQGNTDTASASASVLFTDVAPVLRITKSASPESVPETGADVTFTVVVTNPGPETVTNLTLVDDTFGDLAVTDCTLPASLGIGASYTCSFTRHLVSLALIAHHDVVTVTGRDDDGSSASALDDATVTFTDVLPTIAVDKSVTPGTVPETGGLVDYTIRITNTGTEAVVLTGLVDNRIPLSTDCIALIGQPIAAGAWLECRILAVPLQGEASDSVVNTATATAEDNEHNSATASDDATVTFTDVLPAIHITKSANPTSVLYTGEYVDYTLVITNVGPETATILSLIDDHTSLSAGCLAVLGTVLAPAASTQCVLDHVLVSGPAGSVVVNTASVIVEDNEHNRATDAAQAGVLLWWYGRTPGYWKNHPEAWVGYGTTATIMSVFAIPTALRNGAGQFDIVKPVGQDTLMDALGYKGGATLSGKAQILLRAATASLLNVAYYASGYPGTVSTAALIAYVNGTLATLDANAYVAAAAALDAWNNGNHAPLM